MYQLDGRHSSKENPLAPNKKNTYKKVLLLLSLEKKKLKKFVFCQSATTIIGTYYVQRMNTHFIYLLLVLTLEQHRGKNIMELLFQKYYYYDYYNKKYSYSWRTIKGIVCKDFKHHSRWRMEMVGNDSHSSVVEVKMLLRGERRKAYIFGTMINIVIINSSVCRPCQITWQHWKKYLYICSLISREKNNFLAVHGMEFENEC